MSFERLNAIRRTASFRVILWSTALFVLSSVLLFTLSYLLLANSLEAKDRLGIQFVVSTYAEEFSEGGAKALSTRVDADRASGRLSGMVVRLTDPRGATLISNAGDSSQARRFARATGAAGESARRRRNAMDLLSAPLPDGSTLTVGASREARDDVLERFRDTFLVVLAGIVALGLAGGMLLSSRALRPVRALMNSLQPIIETGELKARVPVHATGDEFQELSILLNRALERIDHVVDSMRASLDNVAHDLRTPMTRLRGVAEMSLASPPDLESYREALSDSLEESANILKMLDALLEISEVEAGSIDLDLAEVDIAGIVGDVVEMYGVVAEEQGIALDATGDALLVIVADRGRVVQAVANLVDNAVKYTRPGGQVHVEARAAGDEAVIVVRDTGIGIPPHESDRVWDRSFRGDASRSKRGLGLGLSLVRAVARAHNGTVELSSTPGVGSEFTLRLPLAHAARPAVVA